MPDDDPFAEEDAACEERLRLHREERSRVWAARGGLVRLGARPQSEAIGALRRSLPGSNDAVRLFGLVEAALGSRAARDAWATPTERCLLVRDPAHPDWFLPERLLYLELEYQEPQPVGNVQIQLPERIRRIAARKAKQAPPPEPPPVVVPLAPAGRPARFIVTEGAASATFTFGDRGQLLGLSLSCGDPFAASEDEPFTLDPFARPKQAPPLSLLLREELDARGLPVEALARLIVELHPERSHGGRVYVPTVQPGMVIGAWSRGLDRLREAEWAGGLGAEAGWAVIDAWNGAALARGETLDAAFAAWRALVRQVQPLPPVPRAAPPPPGPEPPGPVAEPPPGVGRISMGPTEIVVHPPVVMAWPEARPEHVPAAALYLPATPPVPGPLAGLGFTRTVRLLGGLGEVAFAFVREEERGFTMIGDDALPALDLANLEEALDAIDRRTREEFVDVLGRGDPYLKPPYPVQVRSYKVWDELGRHPELRGQSVAWQAELAPRGWDLPLRHCITRVRVHGMGV